MHRKQIAGAVVAAALVVPAAAQAHVTVQPKQAMAGAFTVESIRVPTEVDNASTVKVAVQFPPGQFANVAYQSTPGWTVDVKTSKLAKPIQTDDGPVTAGVDTITWTAGSTADGIGPGQFRDFPLSLAIPSTPGKTLTFKALQTYSNGKVVRWIGAPGADTPAPQVTILPAASATTTTATPAPATPAAAAPASSDGASKGLGIAALVVAIVAALLGAAALLTRRRSTAA
jgi:uncharacterized protein YcnI